MSLFSRVKPETPPVTTDSPSPAADVESVANRVVEMLKPLLAQQQQQPVVVQQSSTQPEEDDDTTPDERARISRVASDVTKTLTGPYADMFNMTMPGYARDNAVSKLTPGEKIIYERYKSEVDSGVDRACYNNPALKAAPMIHENAIRLILGAHTSEIAELAIQHMTVDQLPATFSIPNTTGGGGSATDTATTEEKEWVSYFAPRSRNKDWDVDNMRYYKGIKPGFLHEMIAEHKANLEKQK